MIDFFIDVLDSAGNVIGPGPITSATSWESTGRMDRAGAFRFSFPASDTKATLIFEKRRVRCKAHLDNSWVEVGDGIIDQVDTEVADDGTVMLTVSGQDGAYALAGMNAGIIPLAIGSGSMPAQSGINLLLSTANATYGAGVSSSYSVSANPGVYAQFHGESMLMALGMTTKAAGYHWRWRSSDKTFVFFDTFTTSGVRAIQARGPLAAETCAITNISKSVETHELYTRIVPFGGGTGRARLTLQASNRSIPSGYTGSFLGLGAGGNFIQRTAAASQYGRIDRWVEFKEITPISNTDADLQAAANYLFDVAKLELDRNSVRATHYNLEVAQCRQVLRPGQSIRVVYRDVISGVNIDETLNIIEATIRLDSEGLRTTQLTVSDADRWPLTDSDVVASRIAEGRVFQAHPQLNANSYVQSYTKHVDETETATFRFRFGAEVVQLQQVQFEFQLLQLESTIRTIALQGMSGGSGQLITDQGGGGATTPNNDTSGIPQPNVSDSPSTNTSGPPPPAQSNTDGPNVTSTAGAVGSTGDGGAGSTVLGGGGSTGGGGGGATGPSGTGTTGAGGAGATGGSGSGSTGSGGAGSTDSASGSTSNDGGGSTSGPEGGDTENNGGHYHELNIIRVNDPAASGFRGVYIDPLAEQLYTSGAGNSLNPRTNFRGDHNHNRGNHTHSIGGHTHSVGGHTHSFGDHTHTLIDHTHSFGDHTHSFGDHSHTLTAHSHTLNNHTHGLNSHTHNLNNHTHSLANHTHSMGNHTHPIVHTHSLNNHTHGLNNHTHTMTPTLTTLYGIFRESISNTYGITELEYRVNSGAWLALSGALNVGGGWFRLDVTADLYNAITFRPLQEANTVQIRASAAAGWTILDIQRTGPNLVIQTSPAPTVDLIGKQIRVSGTSNYNGGYTVMDVIFEGSDSYIIILTQGGTPGPRETTGTVTQIKKATIDAQLSVRNIIQAIAYT